MDGESFNNESVKGKTVLVQFWATWCKYCRSDESAVEAVTRDYRDQGLVADLLDSQRVYKALQRLCKDMDCQLRVYGETIHRKGGQAKALRVISAAG